MTQVEVADVFRRAMPKLQLSPDKKRIAQAITKCRTSSLGAHVRACNSCNYREQSYNSCRNRHCPKCQGSIAAKWVDARSKEVLPVSYFHTVFTVPSELRSVTYQNKALVYELLFRAVAQTMEAVAANPKFLGGKITFYTVLHTWNQQLLYHPHIHVVSPKGAISPDDSQWLSSKYNFFLPVRALSKVFSGKFRAALQQAHQQGDLKFYGKLSHLANPTEFAALLSAIKKKNWVVYSKKPFGGAGQVAKYLSSYVHRVAISNHRVRSLSGDTVTFRYRDSKRKNKKSYQTISTTAFTHRFLLHILPKNFTRIRHYGFLANNKKRKYLPIVRALIARALPERTSREFHQGCPKCQSGEMSFFGYFRHRGRHLPEFFAANPPIYLLPQASG